MSILPSRRSGLLVERIDDECVVLDPTTKQALTLDAVGASLLDLCDGRTTQPEACATLGLSGTQLQATLGDLERASLLDTPGISRRSLISGSAVVGGVVIAGVLMPTAAAALSIPGVGSVPVNVPPVKPPL